MSSNVFPWANRTRKSLPGLLLCLSLAAACSTSDGAASRRGPTSPTAPTPPTILIPPVSARLQMSGRVLDENGTPVPGASVVLYYVSAGGVSSPPYSACHPGPSYGRHCWLSTSTNDLGEYSVEFDPLPWGSGFGLGYVNSYRDGYEGDTQWVPTSGSPAVRDLRLRRTRSILAGESIVVSVDATTSLCHGEWVWASRCETFVIESGAGFLFVEARPEAGRPAPTILLYSSHDHSPGPAPGVVAMKVLGGTYRVQVEVPEGAPSQQFNVTTSLR